jgi:hypothetical protein
VNVNRTTERQTFYVVTTTMREYCFSDEAAARRWADAHDGNVTTVVDTRTVWA